MFLLKNSQIPNLWRLTGIFLIAVAFLCASVIGRAQIANGALSGVVADESGGVIPGARVVLKSDATGVTRETISNETGYFKIVAVPPGAYSVLISAPNFANWQVRGILFNQGEDKSLPKIGLKPGSVNETIEVKADIMAVPVDTSEARQTLTSGVFSQMNVESRNAAELIKIMPGMAMNMGLSNKQWGTDTTQTGSGPIGNYSAGGAPPSGGVGLSTDGAAIVDIGSSNTQVANINQDQTAELTIVSGSFGAEYSKGPVSISAISKSGASKFHGGAYVYTRGGTFNSEDSELKVAGKSKPNDHYWYPGFTIGGPVIFPHTNFNHNRDKLFFFVGYEYMMQHPVGTFYQSDVPTDAMLTGDFSGTTSFAGQSATIPCADSNKTSWPYSTAGSFCDTQWNATGGSTVNNGAFSNFNSLKDSNGLAYITMMRNMGTEPNQDPSTHNGYNYGFNVATPANRWDGRVKIDYSFNENTKLSGTFSEQKEGDTYPFGNMYWWPTGGVQYPTAGKATVLSRTVNANLTKVFSAQLTTDLTFAMSYFTLPNKPVDPTAMTPEANNISISTPYSLSDANLLPQIPNIYSWACNTGSNKGCFPHLYSYAFEKDFQGGAVGNIKKVPTAAWNIARTWKTHTAKAGIYWEKDYQTQSDLIVDAQGGFELDPWSTSTTGNPIADLLLGNVDSFSQTGGEPLEYIGRYNWGFFLSDQWKVKRLTLNYGLRFEHNGQWFADNGKGFSVWSDADYVDDPNTASSQSGIISHATKASVPLSGWRSKRFDLSPRVGAAYDIFGNGKTVVRGGFGVYRWQMSIGDPSGSYLMAMGIGNASSSAFSGMSSVSSLPVTVGSLIGSKVNVLKSGEDLTPYTNNWNFIVSQAVPFKSTLELQYQGSHTDNSVVSNNNNSNSSLANYNKIPLGTLLSSSECIANSKYCGSGVSNANFTSSPGAGDQMFYKPYKDYLYVTKVGHGSYSNYHAFVAQWQRQSGAVNWIVNYTFGKVLGIRDGNTQNGNGNGNTADTFNLKNNYGVLAYDHTHIFNATYVWHMPSPMHEHLLATAVNGWELSGITQMQSGAPLQPNSNNLNVNTNVSASDILGSPDAISLPVLTCDPRKGLSSGQYFNPSCFARPTKGTPATASSEAVLGTNGQAIWPYIKGPAFVSSDLAIFKNFKVRESHNVQFRVSAFNFLNHKLKQFGTGNDVQMIMTTPKNASDDSVFTLPDDFTGKPEGITGRRVMEFALKYEF